MMVGQRKKPLGHTRQRRPIKKITGKMYGRSVHDPLNAHAATLGEGSPGKNFHAPAPPAEGRTYVPR